MMLLPKLKEFNIWGDHDLVADEGISFLSSVSSKLKVAPVAAESLRELGWFLSQVDRDRHHQGLTRVPLDTGEVVWMCEEHRTAYRPSIVRDLHALG
jgi:hypothetical protein